MLYGPGSVQNTEGEIKRCLKVVAGVELFFGNGVRQIVAGLATQGDNVHDAQGRLQSKFDFGSVKTVVYVSRSLPRIAEQVVVQRR